MTTAPTRGGCSLARSFARSREGGSAPVSSRLVSFAHRRSLHRLAPGILRGCVTHSTRASIARGCKRWQLSLSLLSISVTLLLIVSLSFLCFSLLFVLLSSSPYDCRPASRISPEQPRIVERSVSLALGGYGVTSTPPDEPPYFSSGWFTFSGLPWLVASRLSLGSARPREEP